MRGAVDRFRLTGLLAAVAASVSPLPASGAGPAIWTVAERDDGCAVEHYPDGPEGGLQFSLLRQADTGYSMSGLAFERYTETGERPQRIEVTADGRMILLLGPPYEMGQQARRWASSHPVDEFFAIASGANEFTVAVDGKKTTVSLAGFAAVRTEYDACIERMATIGPNAPVLIEFNGMNQLAAEAGRQRMLSQKLGYTLTIDAKGNAVDCKLSRDFRRKATEIALCRPILKYSRFRPARDADGNPVSGTYSTAVDFAMWMTQRGYLEPEYR